MMTDTADAVRCAHRILRAPVPGHRRFVGCGEPANRIESQ